MASDDIPPSDDGIFNDYPEVDQRSCRLLGPAALIVQALLGILVILSLVWLLPRFIRSLADANPRSINAIGKSQNVRGESGFSMLLNSWPVRCLFMA